MKSFEEFRSRQEEDLQEAPLLAAPAIGAGIKWGLGAWGTQKLLDLLGWGTGKAKDAAGAVVNQGVKTAKKAWDGGDNKINAVKGTDEKGLPKVS